MGSGTTNYVAKFTSATAVGNSTITDNGTVGINTASPGAQLQVTIGAAATKGFIVKGAASQSANLLEIQNSAGTATSYIDSSYRPILQGIGFGNFGSGLNEIYTPGECYIRCSTGARIYSAATYFLIDDASVVPFQYYTRPGTTTGHLNLLPNSNTTDRIALVCRASSGQTRNIQQWQDSAGTVMANISNVGTLTAVGVTSTAEIQIRNQYALRLYDADSSNYLAIQAPTTISANYTLTMPVDDGNSGQYLQTNGSGVLTWANGPTGAQGAQGAQGSQGAQGFQGAKPAIVPIQTFLGEEYVELLCVEMPEVYFEDFMTVKAGNQGHQSHIVTKEMDSTFMQVCEPGTIKVTAAMPSVAAQVGAKVQGPTVEVEVEGRNIQNRDVDITVRLSGIRAGMVGRRFAKRTYDQMVKNNRFWEQWSQ